MNVSHRVTVAAALDEVWRAVTDVAAIGRLPGATLSSDGDTATGSVKVRLGATQITYRVSGGVVSCDAEAHRLSLSVTGMEARGGGNVVATLTVSLDGAAPGTRIAVDGDITATGRGAAAEAEAWERVVGRQLGAVIPSDQPEQVAVPPSRPAVEVPPAAWSTAAEAGRRRPRDVAPAVGLIVALILWWRLMRRRGSRS